MTDVGIAAVPIAVHPGEDEGMVGARAVWRRMRRNRLSIVGIGLVAFLATMSLFGPLLWTVDPQAQDLASGMQGISTAHPLGTDQLGRDLLARLLHGGRVSLTVAVAIVVVAVVVGGGLGLLSGYIGGRPDYVIMRIMDVILSFPALLLALLISAARGPGIQNTILAVTIPFIPSFARLSRATVLSVREREYVVAARAVGVRPTRIVTRHVLRNSVSPVIVQASIALGIALLEVAGLGYLGLGVQPPTPEWGAILTDAQSYLIQQPIAFIIPGAVIAAAILGFNLLGDALADAMDVSL